jgi:hypothetical protein
MTSRERVDAALEHREPDRTPWFEYVLLPPVAEWLLERPFLDYAGDGAAWLARAREIGFEQAVRRYARDRLDLAERLGHDLLYVVPNPPAHLVDARPRPPPAPAPQNADPVAALQARVEQQARRAAGPGVDQLLVYAELSAQMARRGLDLPVLAPAYHHGIWTDTDLMQVMLLEPDLARQHFALATREALAASKRYLALGIRHIGVGGDIAGNRPLISPAAYREFILPEVRTLSRRLHAAGAVAVNASDGDLWPLIDDFLLGTEVDAYLEIDTGAGMDLGRLKARFGERITFFGAMDCGRVLSFAAPAEVRAETRRLLAAGAGQGGHIFCASNAITASVPVQNYAAMVNAYRDAFGLAPLLPEPACARL